MRRFFILAFLGLASCAAAEGLRPWTKYHTILWVSGSAWAKPELAPLFVQRMKEMGVNTGMVTGDGDASPFVKAGMPYYVENIVGKGLCLKFQSPVTNWSGFINDWMKTRTEAAFVRPYGLDDPEWTAWAQRRMKVVMRHHQPNAPILADIRDELSVTISANPFDYDFSPRSLAGFRDWLRTQYASLEALNKTWATDYPNWEAVRPFSTDQIKARMTTGERLPKGPPNWVELRAVRFDPKEAAKNPVRWNFAPWCDFRSYMDTVLARALSGLRDAAHAVDPATPVGIEGTQMPHAFGGYDLWKLSQSVDWMEPYDVGCSREILGSFMPHAPMLTTVFEKDVEHAARRLWHLLLLGDKGCIVWWSEDCIDVKKPDYPLTAKGQTLATVLREMTSPLAALFMKAEREYDPIAILYSQPSIQVGWLLDSTEDGATWPRRFSSYESQHSRHAMIREVLLRDLEEQGYSPRFVSSEQMSHDALKRGDYAALILPDCWALSSTERQSMDSWAKDREARGKKYCVEVYGGTGRFAEHGVLFQPTHGETLMVGAGSVGTGRIEREDAKGHILDGLPNLPDLAKKVHASYAVERPVNYSPTLSARLHRFRLGSARLLAFERNVNYQMSEDLSQGGGNESKEKPIEFDATLQAKGHVYDLRSKLYLGDVDHLHVALDPWRPSLYAVLPHKLPEGQEVVAALTP